MHPYFCDYLAVKPEVASISGKDPVFSPRKNMRTAASIP